MNRNIDINVTFKEPYLKQPKIKILEPPKVKIKYLDKEGFKITVPVNPHLTSGIRLVYLINDKREETGLLLQFCPACESLLADKWPTINIPIGPNLILHLSICYICGNYFICRRDLSGLLASLRGEKQIIVPGRG